MRFVKFLAALGAAFTIQATPAASIATHFAMIDSTNHFTTTPGATVTGIRFATVDDAYQRVGNQAVTITSLHAHCGSYSGASTIRLRSDADGVLSIPAWTAPMALTNCVYKAELDAAPFDYLVYYYNTGNPFAPLEAVRIGVVNHDSEFTVAAGGTLSSIELAPITANGLFVRNRGITVTSSTPNCGSFGGAAQVQVSSDEGGVAVVPAWTPTGNVETCVLSAQLTGGPESYMGLLIRVTGVQAPPPPPPGPAPGPVTTASGTTTDGAVSLSIAPSVSTCTLAQATFTDPRVALLPAGSPAMLSMPQALIDFRTDNCGNSQQVTFTVEFPRPLPVTAQWWKFGPTPANRTPHWYVIPSTVNGNRISFTIIDGDIGDDDLVANGSISDLGMVSTPGGPVQDLWWSGPAENGWGMSLVQHRDVVFGNIFTYDATGAPTWYVMPDGAWNADHTVYTGALYLPKGSPFYAYDGSRFDVGASVGTMRLTFADANNATMEYTINGVSGRKNITRVLFGPPGSPTDKPLADLWWAGSAQNGWGIALLQQHASLFALWFTYDANGKATWFVMPTINLSGRDDYRGNVYKAVGPPWLGTPYDATRHRLDQVGTFGLRFSGDGATFDYTVEGRTGSIPLSRIPF